MKNNKILDLLFISFILILLSSIPYIHGLNICPKDGVFTGYTKNIDDMAVYGSWVKQCSEHLVIRNLFQENENGGFQVNVYFNVLGAFSKIFKTTPNVTLHIFRILQSFLLVFVFWKFTGLWFNKDIIRKCSLYIFLFAAGFGYIYRASIDYWQPEAITFLSVYLNPLFTIALILIISIYYCLRKLELTKKNKYLILASVYLLILGNIHTYDIVNIYIFWSIYLLYRLYINKNFKLWLKNIYKEIIVLIIGLITPIINLFLYSMDEVYKSRVDTIISTHPIYDIISGYAIPIILAIVGIVALYKNKELKNFTFLLIWIILNLLTIYIPFSQQRKFIMGYEIPVAIFAGYMLYMSIWKLNSGEFGKKVLLGLWILFMFATNAIVMETDILCLNDFTTQAKYCPYLSLDEMDILNKINELDINEPIFAPPQLALFIPEYTGKRVYYGHWSETPDFQKKLKEYADFAKNGVSKQKILIIDKKNNLIFDKNLKMLYNNSSYILYKNR